MERGRPVIEEPQVSLAEVPEQQLDDEKLAQHLAETQRRLEIARVLDVDRDHIESLEDEVTALEREIIVRHREKLQDEERRKEQLIAKYYEILRSELIEASKNPGKIVSRTFDSYTGHGTREERQQLAAEIQEFYQLQPFLVPDWSYPYNRAERGSTSLYAVFHFDKERYDYYQYQKTLSELMKNVLRTASEQVGEWIVFAKNRLPAFTPDNEQRKARAEANALTYLYIDYNHGQNPNFAYPYLDIEKVYSGDTKEYEYRFRIDPERFEAYKRQKQAMLSAETSPAE